MSESRVYIPKFRGHQDNFYIWSAQIKAILKSKKAWKIVRPASSKTSVTDGSIEFLRTSKEAVSEEEAIDLACSVILQGLDEVRIAPVMHYQDDAVKM